MLQEQGKQLVKEMVMAEENNISFTISARGKAGDVPVMEFLKRNFRTLPHERIDSLFGFVERCTLYGGRPFCRPQLSDEDVVALYNHSIGVRLPLTNHYVSEEEYREYQWLFEKYHRQGNSIIITADHLAEWIRRDYPLYQLEASVVKNIDTHEKIDAALALYDTVILPMRLNIQPEFLASIPGEMKKRVTLFANAGCAFNCPAKICYTAISKMNKFTGAQFSCSKATISRKELGMVFFDLNKLRMAGFRRFKLLQAMPGGITGF
ncbi:MAG: hypothetical protein LAC69_04865 [Chlorobium sp.]|nr:hypothetical protein [Chlorobium sp.]